MALSVLNNIPSLVAQNQLEVTNNNLQNTLFQLSSGSRINSGADDPAGLSIANGMQANITALNQSAQNATEGVGQLQVADGALSQVTTLLNRAVTLATEAANGGLTNPQFTAITNEYQSIVNEINQIGNATNFNGSQVFQSSTVPNPNQTDSSGTTSLTAPLTTGQTFTLNVGGNAYAYTPGVAASPWVMSGNGSLTSGLNLTQGNSITINGTQYIAENTAFATSGLSLTADTGINDSGAGGDQLTINYGGHQVQFTAGATSTLGDLLSYVNTNGAQYGISASLSGGNLVIQASGTVANSALTVTANTKLQTDLGGNLAVSGTTTVGNLIQMINNTTATTGLSANLNSGGYLNIQGTNGNTTITNNTLSPQLGVFGPVSTVQNLLSWINGGGGGQFSGVSAGLSSGTTGTLDIVDNLNRNDLSATDYDTALGSNGVTDAFASPNMTGASNVNVFLSDGATNPSYTTVSVAVGPLSATQIGSNSTTLGTQNLGSSSGGSAALTVINTAISDVAAMRGIIGAGINRLNSATNVINTQVQNLTSAQSSIQDANVGQVVANLSKYQVLEQTGISALAQANSTQQAVLKLLQ